MSDCQKLQHIWNPNDGLTDNFFTSYHINVSKYLRDKLS